MGELVELGPQGNLGADHLADLYRLPAHAPGEEDAREDLCGALRGGVPRDHVHIFRRQLPSDGPAQLRLRRSRHRPPERYSARLTSLRRPCYIKDKQDTDYPVSEGLTMQFSASIEYAIHGLVYLAVSRSTNAVLLSASRAPPPCRRATCARCSSSWHARGWLPPTAGSRADSPWRAAPRDQPGRRGAGHRRCPAHLYVHEGKEKMHGHRPVLCLGSLRAGAAADGRGARGHLHRDGGKGNNGPLPRVAEGDPMRMSAETTSFRSEEPHA